MLVSFPSSSLQIRVKYVYTPLVPELVTLDACVGCIRNKHHRICRSEPLLSLGKTICSSVRGAVKNLAIMFGHRK